MFWEFDWMVLDGWIINLHYVYGMANAKIEIGIRREESIPCAYAILLFIPHAWGWMADSMYTIEQTYTDGGFRFLFSFVFDEDVRH